MASTAVFLSQFAVWVRDLRCAAISEPRFRCTATCSSYSANGCPRRLSSRSRRLFSRRSARRRHRDHWRTLARRTWRRAGDRRGQRPVSRRSRFHLGVRAGAGVRRVAGRVLPLSGRIDPSFERAVSTTPFYLLESLVTLRFACSVDLLSHMVDADAGARPAARRGHHARAQRSRCSEAMVQDYVLLARLKGMSELRARDAGGVAQRDRRRRSR